MKVYLVRLKKDPEIKPEYWHGIVGLIAAETPKDLSLIIDEYGEPGDCEYIVMPMGGFLYQTSKMAVPYTAHCERENIPAPDEEEEGKTMAEIDASIEWWGNTLKTLIPSEAWQDAFEDGTLPKGEMKWKSCMTSGEAYGGKPGVVDATIAGPYRLFNLMGARRSPPKRRENKPTINNDDTPPDETH